MTGYPWAHGDTLTAADLNAAIAATPSLLTPSQLATILAQADLSGLPTSNPGGGKLWLNGGVLQVGA